MGSGRAYTKSGSIEKFDGTCVQWGTGTYVGIFSLNSTTGEYTVTAIDKSYEVPFTGQSTNFCYIMYCPSGMPDVAPYGPRKYFAFKPTITPSTPSITVVCGVIKYDTQIELSWGGFPIDRPNATITYYFSTGSSYTIYPNSNGGFIKVAIQNSRDESSTLTRVSGTPSTITYNGITYNLTYSKHN